MVLWTQFPVTLSSSWINLKVSNQDSTEFHRRSRSQESSDRILTSCMPFLSADVTVVKKITKNRNKVLHYESILQRNSMITPLQASLKRKTKRKDRDEAKPAGKGKAVPVVQMVGAILGGNACLSIVSSNDFI